MRGRCFTRLPPPWRRRVGVEEAEAMSDILERISFEIARSSAMAVLRRRGKTPAGTTMTAKLVKAAELLELPDA